MSQLIRSIVLTICLLAAIGQPHILAQTDSSATFLTPADTFHKGRFWTAAGAGTLIYGGFAYGLYQSWYKDYELTGFHTFNDLHEWQQMDKMGHLFTTHFEANLLYSGARWAGVKPKVAAWTAVGASLWLQTTVEVMDGFSKKWGFSWADMAFNVAGAGLFIGQEYLWGEQRILMKVSSDITKTYPPLRVFSDDGMYSTTLEQRARSLYGSSFGEKFIKDYNAQTIWASVNLKSFAGPQSNWPDWLNIAFGYGAENMYGGFDNRWTDPESGSEIRLSDAGFPRFRQYYLSLDIDLSRIKTKSRVLSTLFRCLNYVKIPAPALEVNGLGGVKGHWLHW